MNLEAEAKEAHRRLGAYAKIKQILLIVIGENVE